MHNKGQHFKKVGSAPRGAIGTAVSLQTAQLATDQIPFLAKYWLQDCQIRQHSERTVELRKLLLNRLQWFLAHRQEMICGKYELRAFLLT